MTEDIRPKRYVIDLIIGGLLGLSAGILYRITMAVGTFPGDSAHWVVQQTGIFPRVTPSHPLWFWVTAIVRRGSNTDLASQLNWLSVVAGALSIWLLYDIMSGGLYQLIDATRHNRLRAAIAARLGGVFSAVSLALAIPFWVVSTRAHVLSLDILLLLIVTRLFLAYAQSANLLWAYGLALVYGVGTVESATLIPFALLFGPCLLLLMWRHEHIRPTTLFPLITCAVAGLAVYFLAAWPFFESEGYHLRGYTNYFQIVWFMWRDQAHELAGSLPQSGWLMVLIVTVVPWLGGLAVVKRGLNEERDVTYYLLHVILIAPIALVLFNVDRVAPWRLLGFSRLLVTPYLLVSSLLGYLAAYWFLAPHAWWATADDEERGKLFCRRWLGIVLVLPLTGLLVWPPKTNLPEADGRASAIIKAYADEVIDSLAGRSWLITDGVFDDHLLIAAAQKSIDLKLLNLRGDNDTMYVRRLVSLLSDPQLKNLTDIGMITLVQAWLAEQPKAAQQLAALVEPDLWIGADHQVIPHKAVYLGGREVDADDARRDFDDSLAFWNDTVPAMLETAPTDGPLVPYAAYIRRLLSKSANNHGVLMENVGDATRAFQAYRIARRLMPGNISALLNQKVLLNRGYQGEGHDEAAEAWAQFEADRTPVPQAWTLSRHYGYVRMPSAFASTGLAWAKSGEPGIAVASLKRAMDMLPDNARVPLQMTLADMYRVQGNRQASEEALRQVLAKDPTHRQALIQLASLTTQAGRFSETKTLLARALEVGVPRADVALVWARAHLLAGTHERARVILEDLIELQPDHLPAHILLAELFLRQKNQPELDQCLDRLTTLPGGKLFAAVLQGFLALQEKDMASARLYFEEALRLQPKNTRILGDLLRLDFVQQRPELAREHAIRLLKLAPDHPFANHIMASFKLEAKEYEQAESLLRKTLAQDRSYLVLNDLAWALQAQAKYEEAETLAREAVAKNDTLGFAWDTLGVILTKNGQTREAETTLIRARALTGNAPATLLHLADLYVAMDRRTDAHELLKTLDTLRDQLTTDQQTILAQLKRDSGL